MKAQLKRFLVRWPTLLRIARSIAHCKDHWLALPLIQHRLALPLIRHLRCLQLRRVTVLYPGRAQGTQIPRYYWADFLQKHRGDVRGRVLEIGTTHTVHRVGGLNVRQAVAIDIVPSNNEETIVADLAKADHLLSDQFDCFVNQFTMHVIYDFKDALYHSIRLLKPGGVLLVNFLARSGYPDQGFDLKEAGKTWVYWWFTPALVEKVLEGLGLTEKDYEIKTYGNFFALVAYMAGIRAEELTPYELEYEDSDIPLLICARVIKPLQWSVCKHNGDQ